MLSALTNHLLESPLSDMTEKRKIPTPRQNIDESLRQVYKEIDEEGVPDRFAQLLESLRNKEASKSSGGQDNE